MRLCRPRARRSESCLWRAAGETRRASPSGAGGRANS
jgi:hypothetical protein